MLLIRLVNAWMSTLNYRSAAYAQGTDPVMDDFAGPAILSSGMSTSQCRFIFGLALAWPCC